jgi:probable HAF family extracellular repeat protein
MKNLILLASIMSILLPVIEAETLVAQNLTWLGTLGGSYSISTGVSDNGSLVAGYSEDNLGRDRAFYWNQVNGLQDIGTLGGNQSKAFGMNNNGSVIVGWAEDSSLNTRAFRWTQLSGMQDIGGNYYLSIANAVSTDGSEIVGLAAEIGGNNFAFLWTQASGIQNLGTLGGNASKSLAISGYDSVVVGDALNSGSLTRPFRWTQTGGMQDLGTLGGDDGQAINVSNDGSIIAGWAEDISLKKHAFRWTSAGMQDLGTLGGNESIATDLSSDGSIIVGWAYNSSNEYRAFRWIQSIGMQDLNQIFSGLLTNGSYLIFASGISSDGRYITGYGFNAATGLNEAFLLDTGGASSIEISEQNPNSRQLWLKQNYPNPFNPSTTISWQSPVSSWQTLKVYDALGNEVATLVDDYKPAGSYEIEFDASDLPSGIYLYKLTAGEFTSVKKLMLLK